MFKELTYLNPFFESPSKELGVREFARLAKMNPATASKILKNFAKKDQALTSHVDIATLNDLIQLL